MEFVHFENQTSRNSTISRRKREFFLFFFLSFFSPNSKRIDRVLRDIAVYPISTPIFLFTYTLSRFQWRKNLEGWKEIKLRLTREPIALKSSGKERKSGEGKSRKRGWKGLERSLIAGIENVCYSKEERVEKGGGEKRKKRKKNDVDRRTRKYRARGG